MRTDMMQLQNKDTGEYAPSRLVMTKEEAVPPPSGFSGPGRHERSILAVT